MEQAGAEDQQQREDGRAGEPRELTLRADVLGDRGARAARGDREALREPGGDIGDPEDPELAVLVDVDVKPARVAARQHARVGERDERDTDRGGEERLEVGERDIGESDHRQAGGDGADHRHAIVEAQRGDDRGGADDRDEDARHPGRPATQGQHQHKRSGAERERSRVGLVEAGDEVDRAAHEALGVDREAEELGQLLDDDRRGDAHEVAEPHRQRQQLGDEAEARQPTGEHDRADEDGEQAGEGDPLGSVAGRRQRDDRGGDERGDGGVRAQDEDRRRAQQEVDDERHQGRVQPGDRRHAGELGVGHALRDEERGEDGPRHQVAPQCGAAMAREQRQPRHPTTDPLEPLLHGATLAPGRGRDCG